MLVVGLTGGIASGKSTITRWFLEKGIIVLDADLIVRELQRPGGPLFNELVREFGHEIIDENGELSRQKLASIIFYDDEAKQRINQLTHPLVKEKLEEGIKTATRKKEQLIILDVPLLFETKFDSLTDCVVVVDVSLENQIRRLMKRDQIEENYARAKINSQMPLKEKVVRSDYVLNNNGDISNLRTQFEVVFEQLWSRACDCM